MILGGQISAPNNTASSRGRARRREFAGDPVARSCRVRPMEGGLQLPTVEPVPEREGLSPGSETRTLRVSGSGSGGRIRCAHFGRGSSQVPDDAAQHSTAVNTSHRRRPHLPHPSTFIRRASSRLAPDIQQRIAEAPTAREAAAIGRTPGLGIDPGWNARRVDVMRWVLRMKREANQAEIDAVLTATDNRPIVEVQGTCAP